MLTTIIAGTVLIGLLFAAMAIGVILRNRPLRGSCGGVGPRNLDGRCGTCGKAVVDCDRPEDPAR